MKSIDRHPLAALLFAILGGLSYVISVAALVHARDSDATTKIAILLAVLPLIMASAYSFLFTKRMWRGRPE